MILSGATIIENTISSALVEMLIHNMRGHTILKDAKTGKCLDINAAHLEVYGLKHAHELILEKLYQYYRYFYKNQKIAIAKFLQHVGILDYFETLPTPAEIRVLIAKKRFSQNKLVALHLNITEGTLESHINKIINKLKLNSFNLNNMLLNMNIRK